MRIPSFEAILVWLIVPLVLFIVGLGFVNICMRVVLGSSLYWTEEVIRYGFIWVFWLASPMALKRSGAFAVDFVVRLLPSTGYRLVMAAGRLLVGALLAVFIWQGIQMTLVTWDQQSSALMLPMGWVYMSIPVGCTLMLCVVIGDLIAFAQGDFSAVTAPQDLDEATI
jgi:TRAP-type C4-dicarboxylate transport system permease small subunit